MAVKISYVHYIRIFYMVRIVETYFRYKELDKEAQV